MKNTSNVKEGNSGKQTSEDRNDSGGGTGSDGTSVHSGDVGDDGVDGGRSVPLSEEQLQYQTLLSFTPDQWDIYLDSHHLNYLATQDQPVVPRLEPPSKGGNDFRYVKTYDIVGRHGKIMWTPLDHHRRRALLPEEVHFWVYLCRYWFQLSILVSILGTCFISR